MFRDDLVLLMAAIAAASLTTSAIAAVSAEEAKQLGGTTLTTFGAEKAGNKDGTIPEYTGIPVKAPADWNPKEPGRRPDPFNEKPLFTITAQNADKYADKLDGLMAVFKKYPKFRMDVYPSHRTAVYPKYHLENTVKNATQCLTSSNELKLEGCYGGVPFPIPKTGNQVMWNHVTAYEQVNWAAVSKQYIVPPTGAPVLTNGANITQQEPFFDPAKKTAAQDRDIYWRVRLDYFAPPRSVGEKLVVIDHMDSVDIGRRAYQYLPGQRRVKLAPDLAYDTPNPTSGGSQAIDDSKTFAGAQNRFDFKLIGKKEKFIPYNAFNVSDYKTCPEDKLYGTKNFPNPDCIRWELHRVWEVQATLKPTFRHIYPKRKFFYDEDTYGAGISENYDATGQLYRMIVLLPYPIFEGGWHFSSFYAMDLATGSWSLLGGHNFPGGGFSQTPPKSDIYFSPEALAGEGVR